MDKNKVEITVKNQNYTVITDEPAGDVLSIVNELNGMLDAMMDSGKITTTQGLILACLDFATRAKTQTALAEKYKNEIADYLEDAEKAMTERDKYKREIEKLKEKLKNQ